MHSTLMLCTLSTILLGCLPTAFATQTKEDVPAVVQHMREVNRAFRLLRRQIDDPTMKAANLNLIAQIRSSLTAAKREEPLKTPELSPSERDPFLKAYRELLEEVLAVLEKLEGAVEEGRITEAQDYIGQINEMKKQGHEKFQKEE
ncbi:MAG: cytochrome b562 [bacterium]